MGVKICPNCGKKVSESRMDCIHCGYVFGAKKKCPDCGAELDESVIECPECGFYFQKEEKPVIPEENKIEEPKLEEALPEEQPAVEEVSQPAASKQCPYCGGNELMELGTGLYLCQTCRNKVLLADGLPAAPRVSQVKQQAPSAVIPTQEQDSVDEANEEKPGKKKAKAPVEDYEEEVPTGKNGFGYALFFVIFALVLSIAPIALLASAPLGIHDGIFGDYIYLFGDYYVSAFISFGFSILTFVLQAICLGIFFRQSKSEKPIAGIVLSAITILSALSTTIAFCMIKYESFDSDFDSTTTGPMIAIFSMLVIVFSIALISFYASKLKRRPIYISGAKESWNVLLQVLTAMFVMAAFTLLISSVLKYSSVTREVYDEYYGDYYYRRFTLSYFLEELLFYESQETAFAFTIIALTASLSSLFALAWRNKIVNCVGLGLNVICALFSGLAAYNFSNINEVDGYIGEYSIGGKLFIIFILVAVGFAIGGALLHLFSFLSKLKKKS